MPALEGAVATTGGVVATRSPERTAAGRTCRSGSGVGRSTPKVGSTVGPTGGPDRTPSRTRRTISGGHPVTGGRRTGSATSSRPVAATSIGRVRPGNPTTTATRTRGAGATAVVPARTRFPTTISGATPRRTAINRTVFGSGGGIVSATKDAGEGSSPGHRPTSRAARPATRAGTLQAGAVSITGATLPTIKATAGVTTPDG